MEHFLSHWTYLALFGVTVLSSLGIPVGSEIAIGFAGALASGHLATAHLNLASVILVAAAGEVVGSTAGYMIGRYGGRPLVEHVGKYVLVTHRDLDRAEAWFARRGDPFVFFGRFIPLLRSFVSVAAGLGEMAYGKFLLYTTVACVAWCAALASIGDSLGATWHHVLNGFSDAGYVVAVLLVLAVVGLLLHRLRAVRREGSPGHAGAGGRSGDGTEPGGAPGFGSPDATGSSLGAQGELGSATLIASSRSAGPRHAPRHASQPGPRPAVRLVPRPISTEAEPPMMPGSQPGDPAT